MEMKIACAGYEIAADWYEGADSEKILIVLPGYTSSKARQKVHAEAMVQGTGTSALVVDFSGHGNSPFDIRDTRPGQHLLELIYVFDWVKAHYPTAEISLSGSSYGGYLAALLTEFREFKNLVLRAPAMYKSSALYDLWSIRIDDPDPYSIHAKEYRSDELALSEHPVLKQASYFQGRCLVVVHSEDELVPKQTTDAYTKAFRADTYIAEGFAHTIDKNDVGDLKLQAYQDYIADWLK